jgi:hypothetical protein
VACRPCCANVCACNHPLPRTALLGKSGAKRRHLCPTSDPCATVVRHLGDEVLLRGGRVACEQVARLGRSTVPGRSMGRPAANTVNRSTQARWCRSAGSAAGASGPVSQKNTPSGRSPQPTLRRPAPTGPNARSSLRRTTPAAMTAQRISADVDVHRRARRRLVRSASRRRGDGARHARQSCTQRNRRWRR